MKKEIITLLAKNYFEEACSFIGHKSNEKNYLLEYVKFPLPIRYDVKQCCFYINEGCIENRHDIQISNMLRNLMYGEAWCFAKGYSEITTRNAKILSQAFIFTTALKLVKGIQPSSDTNSPLLIDEAVNLLNHEFGMDCIARGEQTPNGPFYFLEKNEPNLLRERNKFEQAYKNVKLFSTQVTEKGAYDCPFENIFEAAEFIQKEEKRAYENDTFINQVAAHHYFINLSDNIYQTSWLSPYVSMYKNDFPKDSFIVNRLASCNTKFSLKPNLYRRKFLYRGQSDYYDQCVPSLYRIDKTTYLEDLIWAQELETLVKSHPLVKLLSKGFLLHCDLFQFEMNYLGLTQHYYNKSAYLDLTSDLDSALFFATSKYDSDKDEYHFDNRDEGVGVLYYYELNYPKAFQNDETQGISLHTIGKQVFQRSGAQHGFLLRMNKGINFNNLECTRKVFFKRNSSIAKQIYDKSMGGSIYFPFDILEHNWKGRMQDIAHGRKFVSMETVKHNANLNRTTVSSIIRQLLDHDIRISNTDTTFSRSELNTYYQDIKNGWWQDCFAKDIFFHGSEGILYKQALEDLPLNREYRNAFYNK